MLQRIKITEYSVAYLFRIFHPTHVRYLLKFGEASDYLGYNAMNDFFPRMTMRPNKDCDEFHCRDKQKIFCKAEEERKKLEALTKV